MNERIILTDAEKNLELPKLLALAQDGARFSCTWPVHPFVLVMFIRRALAAEQQVADLKAELAKVEAEEEADDDDGPFLDALQAVARGYERLCEQPGRLAPILDRDRFGVATILRPLLRCQDLLTEIEHLWDGGDADRLAFETAIRQLALHATLALMVLLEERRAEADTAEEQMALTQEVGDDDCHGKD